MILQTVKSLTKLNNTKLKIFVPIMKAFIIWRCIRKYVKNLNSLNLSTVLTDLVYACSAFDIDKVEDEDFSFSYNIENAEKNSFFINIRLNAITLKISHANNYFKFEFKNNQFTYNGYYDQQSKFGSCNDNIQYEIYATLITTIYNVLSYIFTLTPKYKYTI
jgi:hypothetical protein